MTNTRRGSLLTDDGRHVVDVYYTLVRVVDRSGREDLHGHFTWDGPIGAVQSGPYCLRLSDSDEVLILVNNVSVSLNRTSGSIRATFIGNLGRSN